MNNNSKNNLGDIKFKTNLPNLTNTTPLSKEAVVELFKLIDNINKSQHTHQQISNTHLHTRNSQNDTI